MWFMAFVQITFAQDMINRLEYSGNDHFTDSRLIQWGGLQKGSLITPPLIAVANKKIIKGYQEEGYLYARIDSTIITRTGDDKRAGIRWYINEGDLVRLGTVKLLADQINAEILENWVDFNEGDIYRREYIESEIKSIGHYYATIGYPLATIDIIKTSLRQDDDDKYIDLELKIDRGNNISINSIRLKGNNVTDDKVILREIGLQSGEIFNQDKIDDIPLSLNKLGYFKNVKPVKIIGLHDGKTDLLIEMEENTTTTFDGIIGYIPPEQGQKSDEGYFTGLIHLNFRNLFGTGRKFEVNWRKLDKYSEEFRIFYEEPWVFNYPINVGVGLERVVRDTTYIERSYFLNSVLKISTNLKGFLKFSQKDVYPDSLASRRLRMTQNSISDGEIGIEYDTRDYFVNPRKGLRYIASFAYGSKKNTGPAYLIREDSLATREGINKLQLSLSFYQSLWKNQVIAFKIHGAHIESDKDQLQLSDHIWFGGFGSLRGYREAQFHGTTVSWINLEYRFLVGRNSRVFLFNDWGFYQYQDTLGIRNDILPGFGIGIRFESPLGIMGVDYGLGRGDSFSTGKIHFGIINSF